MSMSVRVLEAMRFGIIMATVAKSDGTVFEFKLSDFPVGEKLEKFMEDVK